MGKKLRRSIIGLLFFSAGGIVFILSKTSKEPTPAGRFEVNFVSSASEEVYKEIDIRDEKGIKANTGRKVKASFLLKYVKNSRSKKAIFLIPDGSKIKVVLFTDPSRNAQKFKELKGGEGKEIMVKGKLLSHPKYGIEIIVDDIEFLE